MQDYSDIATPPGYGPLSCFSIRTWGYDGFVARGEVLGPNGYVEFFITPMTYVVFKNDIADAEVLAALQCAVIEAFRAKINRRIDLSEQDMRGALEDARWRKDHPICSEAAR